MKHNLCHLFFLFVLLFHGNVVAQQQMMTPSPANYGFRSLSISEIRNMATTNHPAVRQAARQAEAFRGAWVQAGLQENPSIGYSGEEMSDKNMGKQGVTYTQPIVPKYKRTARQSTIDKEYQAALKQYQVQCQKVLNDATLAAYRVAFAQRKCRLMDDLSVIAQNSQRVGDELLKAKEISRPAFLDIKIQSERTKIVRGDAEIACRTASKELAILLGLPEDDAIEITDAVETMPREILESDLLTRLKSSSPELQKAYADVETAKANLRQQSTESGIDYDTNAKVAYNNEAKNTEFSVGIAVPIKIFNRNQGNIQHARSELEAAQSNVARVETKLAHRFEKQLGEYQIARNRVVSYRDKILAEAGESLNLAQDAYRRGEYNSLELLDAQRTYSTVNIEYLENMSSLMESQTLLEGSLLSGGLDSPGSE